jgi:hypothetical protein
MDLPPLMQNVIAVYRTPRGGVNHHRKKRVGVHNTTTGRIPGHEEWIDLMRDRDTQGLDIWTGEPRDDVNK